MRVFIEGINPELEGIKYIPLTVLLYDIIDFPDSLSPSIAVSVMIEKGDYKLSDLRKLALDQTRSLLSHALDEMENSKE
jgi:hypothetical protein